MFNVSIVTEVHIKETLHSVKFYRNKVNVLLVRHSNTTSNAIISKSHLNLGRPREPGPRTQYG